VVGLSKIVSQLGCAIACASNVAASDSAASLTKIVFARRGPKWNGRSKRTTLARFEVCDAADRIVNREEVSFLESRHKMTSDIRCLEWALREASNATCWCNVAAEILR
jgi:hypothetical protein